MIEPARVWRQSDRGAAVAHAWHASALALNHREYEQILQPSGRLDWILGFASDAPETRITATFSPIVYCVEPDAAAPARLRVHSMRHIPHGRIVRSYKIWKLEQLQLGCCFAYDKPLQGRLTSRIVPESRQSRHYKIDVKLVPSNGRFYIAGGRHELPARLRKTISIHGDIPDGVTFFAFTCSSAKSNLTVVVPCAEILRSCYGGRIDYRELGKTAPTMRDARGRARSENGINGGKLLWSGADSCVIDAMLHEEPKQLLRRALIYGRIGHPRPILIKPPYAGDVVVRGNGYADEDEEGEITFIASRFLIEGRLAHELNERALTLLTRDLHDQGASRKARFQSMLGGKI